MTTTNCFEMKFCIVFTPRDDLDGDDIADNEMKTESMLDAIENCKARMDEYIKKNIPDEMVCTVISGCKYLPEEEV